MANTSLLKRRIKTAQNVSKTTKAMQMIAASKLKTAQNAALEARHYAKTISEIIRSLTIKLGNEELPYYMEDTKELKKTLLIILSPDKGLCGGLTTNLLKELTAYDKSEECYFLTVGKKAENYITQSKKELIASFEFGTTLPTLDIIYPITQIVDEYFLNKKVGRVKILFSYFSNIFLSRPKIIDVLPVMPESQDVDKISDAFIFEPSLDSVLKFLLKRYIENTLYQSLLESFLSEQASRMIAMQNATNNAKDIIYELTLEYNKARQEKITNEILDISSASNILL